jgi:hypothetical protein
MLDVGGLDVNYTQRSGLLCKSPAVKEWNFYRMHGALGGQSRGPAHPMWVSGLRSRDAIETRAAISLLLKAAKFCREAINSD